MEPERGLARRQVGHFEIPPPHAPPPARADGFHARLLGRESSGKTFVTVSLPLDVRDLGRRVNPLDEAPAMALDGRPNPPTAGGIKPRWKTPRPWRSMAARIRGTSARSTPVPTIISTPHPIVTGILTMRPAQLSQGPWQARIPIMS